MRFFNSRRGSRRSNNNTNYDSNDFHNQAEYLIPAEVRMISGCHSEQTSADVSNVSSVSKLPNPAGRAGGACTSALLDILYRNKQQLRYGGAKPISFQDLLLELRSNLDLKGFSQIPQLSSSRPLEVQETPFQLVGQNGTATGRRRALLVGINYRGQDGELNGCHNDVHNVKKYIMEEHGFPEYDILVLLDDGKHAYPTRQKIILALRQMVAQSIAGDSVYFHYSGHGGLLSPDGNMFKVNQKEYDETIYPLDHEKAGHIRDFSLFNHFVKPMAAGVTVTCVMDCCHSGSVLDLPYTFQPTEGGTIAMRENLDSLSNLAFLYLLAGNMLPTHGFEGLTNHLEENVDGDLADYQGLGNEMEANDFESDAAFLEENDFGGDDAVDAGDVGGDFAGYGDSGGGSGADFGGAGDDFDPAAAADFGGDDDNEAVFSPPSMSMVDDIDYDEAPAVGGFVMPPAMGGVDEDFDRGFGDDGGDGGGEDIDCSCLGDILGALLEQDDE